MPSGSFDRDRYAGGASALLEGIWYEQQANCSL
jgi:hypothetical protein